MRNGFIWGVAQYNFALIGPHQDTQISVILLVIFGSVVGFASAIQQSSTSSSKGRFKRCTIAVERPGIWNNENYFKHKAIIYYPGHL